MQLLENGAESRSYSNKTILDDISQTFSICFRSMKRLFTKDLICWSYQVIRGMDYLTSKKVMHGDLACRNILLAENNIIKICDFGLAKDMYKSSTYQKKSNGPLPVKWMAVESIKDRIFSTEVCICHLYVQAEKEKY